MRLGRRTRMVQLLQRAAANLEARRASKAAGIHFIKPELVHKSTFALMGCAVPSSALLRLSYCAPVFA
ncbi:hypothetical protein HDF17_001731 [Granulicella arctica]|uniref:Uncharacterized protein n=1 Tax=Granulicella arctica TaxID=940613 RepID=A0A7Y9PGH2_9BACT|nr:hypothetical protein [Granulicella arctica]